MDWIKRQINLASKIVATAFEKELLDVLLHRVEEVIVRNNWITEETQPVRRVVLAAAFDLFVMAEYYCSVGHVGWCYCPYHNPNPMLFYLYTNACPSCVLKGNFYYSRANKPSSGSIGVATSRLLSLLLQELFTRKGHKVDIFRGSEPVDTIFLDKSVEPVVALFAEVKSSPLVTLPLAVVSERMTVQGVEQDLTIVNQHQQATTSLYSSTINIFLPVINENSDWEIQLFPLEEKENEVDHKWGYRAISTLLRNDASFFNHYIRFWSNAYAAYAKDNEHTSPIFWLTNGCGQPSPRPSSWPKRKTGKGYESVSDGKTSVGMDRTDDIKKGIYQALKLGVEGKPNEEIRYLVAIVSNIHAVRHFDEYLTSFKDIVWTRDITGKAKVTSDIPAGAPVFNLLDGIVALTKTVSRDRWIDSIFDF